MTQYVKIFICIVRKLPILKTIIWIISCNKWWETKCTKWNHHVINFCLFISIDSPNTPSKEFCMIFKHGFDYTWQCPRTYFDLIWSNTREFLGRFGLIPKRGKFRFLRIIFSKREARERQNCLWTTQWRFQHEMWSHVSYSVRDNSAWTQ